MNDGERARRDLASGQFRTTLHARRRMAERMVSEMDIVEVGRTAESIEAQENGKYRLSGRDLDGDRLEVVCAYIGETLVVTVF